MSRALSIQYYSLVLSCTVVNSANSANLIDRAIPGKPDVVIRPPALTGLPKPTSIYPNHPHCVNSLIIGNLGKLEILLIAFDDGDVYSYYTKDIEAEVQSRKTDRNLSTLAEIKPFFRESVNDSAWGISAISILWRFI